VTAALQKGTGQPEPQSAIPAPLDLASEDQRRGRTAEVDRDVDDGLWNERRVAPVEPAFRQRETFDARAVAT
jgi:hypothetical protein